MLQRIVPKSTTQAQALPLPFDGEEAFAPVNEAQGSRSALYALAVAVRIGLVAAILLRVWAVWYW
jgi:hypothetical protein